MNTAVAKSSLKSINKQQWLALFSAQAGYMLDAMDVLLYDGTRMHVGPTSPQEMEAHIRAGGRPGEIYSAIKSLVDRYGNLIRERFPRLQRRVSRSSGPYISRKP